MRCFNFILFRKKEIFYKQLFADKDLDKNPFKILEEDVVDASPDFNIIDEDEIDDELLNIM